MIRTVNALYPNSSQSVTQSGTFTQYANESIQYAIDYSGLLEEAEQISASVWNISENEQLGKLDQISNTEPLFTAKQSTVRITTLLDVWYGYSFLIVNTITTTLNNKYTRYFLIEIVGIEN